MGEWRGWERGITHIDMVHPRVQTLKGTQPTWNPSTEKRGITEELGAAPTFNTIAEIKGSKKPDEYVILSALFDSWDGGTGATDNGTVTLVMMETMRILKKLLPNSKRTILVGHWGSEEQGLSGSRAHVEDHPEIVGNIQAVFNQDNGIGRVVRVSEGRFRDFYDYISRWLSADIDLYSQLEPRYGFKKKKSLADKPTNRGTEYLALPTIHQQKRRSVGTYHKFPFGLLKIKPNLISTIKTGFSLDLLN